MGQNGPVPRRRLGWLWVLLTVGSLLNGLRLRQRLSGLRSLEPAATGTGETSSSETGSGDDDFTLIAGQGVTVSAGVRAAAVRYAGNEGLDVVDLVPAALSPDQALDLARGLDTTSYRAAPLAPGRGARHAVLTRTAVADRAQLAAAAPASDRAAFVRLTERLKQLAARTTDVVVAPELAAVETPPDQRRGELEALYGAFTPLALAIPATRSSLLLLGMLASPGWGAAALAAFVAQPYLATAGTPLHPPAPSPGAAVARLVAPFAVLRDALRNSEAPGADPVESRRAAYASELVGGTARFFEPRRTTCPWCGGRALDERLRTPDLVQFKPGEFVLEECRTCALVFQNPRLTIAGLDFYYRDVYDGLGAPGIQFLFAQSEPSYRGRVALARRHAAPETWLDVGTGYGHFCLIARGILPDTRFDGLDMGTSIDEAQQRGWVDHAYRGLFPDLVDEMAGRYDIVSMHHYLEHTRDPRAELDAARVALKPGGHLLIEVPDPESRFGRLFGKYWVPWLQPQHQQFLSVAHVSAALEAQGFAVVEVERGPAHQPVDIGGAIGMWILATAPPSRLPWLDPPTTADKVKRAAILGVMAPLAIAGVLADRALQPFIRRRGAGWASAYRILARRL